MLKILGLNSQIGKKKKPNISISLSLCALSPAELISTVTPLGHFLKSSPGVLYLAPMGESVWKQESFSYSDSLKMLFFSQKSEKACVVLPGRGNRLCNFVEDSFDLLASFTCLRELGSCVLRIAIHHQILAHHAQLARYTLAEYMSVFRKVSSGSCIASKPTNQFGVLFLVLFEYYPSAKDKGSPLNLLGIFKSLIGLFLAHSN